MSELKVDKITPRLGTTLTLGDSGDTINFGSGVLPNFENLTVTGDLTVDTNSLYVDSANNKVGIGTTSPDSYYSDQLVISCPAEGGVTLVSQGTTQASYLCFADGTTGNEAYRGYVRYSHNTDSLQFASAAAINMTIDSSGNVGIGTSSPSYTLQVDHQGSENVTVVAKGTAPGFGLYDTTTSAYNWALYNSNGDLTFYNTLNTNGFNSLSEKMRISSTGKVGIGTSSPTYKLEVVESGGRARFKFNSTAAFLDIKQGEIDATNNVRLQAGGTTSTYLEYRGYLGHIWVNDTTERMRIDSSGNVHIGKTARADNTVGHSLQADGLAVHTRDGAELLFLNRKTSDGKIVSVRKDNTEVGSISTQGGTLEIGSGDVYLQFNGANDWIKPVDGSGNNKSGVDLGTSGAKFDNLYLGGNIYLGGTTSANALDDYEEGTWTASYGASGTNTGYYTKVGRLVTLNIILTGTSQTFDQITGLPFSSDLATGAVTFGRILSVGSGKDRSNVGGNTSGTTLFLYNENATSSSLTTGSGTVRLDITVTYLTNS